MDKLIGVDKRKCFRPGCKRKAVWTDWAGWRWCWLHTLKQRMSGKVRVKR